MNKNSQNFKIKYSLISDLLNAGTRFYNKMNENSQNFKIKYSLICGLLRGRGGHQILLKISSYFYFSISKKIRYQYHIMIIQIIFSRTRNSQLILILLQIYEIYEICGILGYIGSVGSEHYLEIWWLAPCCSRFRSFSYCYEMIFSLLLIAGLRGL